jgi:hypothetical protein
MYAPLRITKSEIGCEHRAGFDLRTGLESIWCGIPKLEIECERDYRDFGNMLGCGILSVCAFRLVCVILPGNFLPASIYKSLDHWCRTPGADGADWGGPGR